MHTFYIPEAAKATINSMVALSPEESAHCAKVLRLKQGDEVEIIDGIGNKYVATIVSANKNQCMVNLTKKKNDVYIRPYYNHVAIAPTKNIERMEWFVEKAVEFGIDEITPLLCQHSERKILKLDRLEKIIISAVKQSGNAIVPKLNQLTPFNQILDSQLPIKMIAHCEDDQKNFFVDYCQTKSQSLTLIGPEGDFSKEEIQTAINKGFAPISLGNTRLRTETAGVAVCAFLTAINTQNN